MADIVTNIYIPLPDNTNRRYKDMGDGTWAEVVSAAISGGVLPAALGQAVMAASLPVAIASNQSAVPTTVSSVAIPSTLVHGKTTVTTAGTEVALGASTTLLSGVHVKALSANTGLVYVGANPVTSTTGYQLAAGEEVFIEIANLATIYVDAAVNGEGVTYIGS